VSRLPPETHEKEQLAVRGTTTQPWEQLATLSDLLVFEPLVRHHGLIEVLHVRPHALASLHTWCASTKTLMSVAKPKITMTFKTSTIDFIYGLHEENLMGLA